MYRKLLASTALALVVTGGAYAQEMAPADPAMAPADPAAAAPAEAPEQELVTAEETGINADGWLATEIIGETIYNSTGEDAESIGDVNDFVLDQNGEIGAVVVGVGGFLGIGQKNVAINWDDLELAQDMDGNNRLVAAMTREQLEAAAEFNREEWLASEAQAAAEMDAMAPAAPAGDAMAPAAPAGDAMAPAAPADDAMAPADDAAAPADNAAAPADDAAAPADDAAAPADDAAAPADDAAAPADDAAAPADDAAAPADDAAAPADDAAAPADDAAAPADDAAAPADDAAAPADDAAAPADDAAAPADDAAAPADDAMAPADDAAAAPAFDTFEQVATADISADELTGTAVYGAGDEEIGSIGDIILSEDGAVQAVIIDFGGFLGIGTKPVAVSFENLSFLRDENGALLLRTPLTAEQLEAAPEYNEEAYTTAPEENTLLVE